MKKTLFTVLAMALMLISTSSYNRDNAKAEVGAYAPAFTLSNESGALELAQLRGNYVLLTFWSSADAASRANCNKYSAWVDANHLENLSYVAVNLDEDGILFEEISRIDGLNQSAQYRAEGHAAAQLRQDYGLDKGYGSILIGPDGRVESFNPTPAEISAQCAMLD